eukprot:352476-Chlamydomonas_euryale.AAC.24
MRVGRKAQYCKAQLACRCSENKDNAAQKYSRYSCRCTSGVIPSTAVWIADGGRRYAAHKRAIDSGHGPLAYGIQTRCSAAWPQPQRSDLSSLLCAASFLGARLRKATEHGAGRGTAAREFRAVGTRALSR